jgi:hypothetical protein
VQDANGAVVTDAGRLAIGAELHITLALGWALAEVKERGGVRSSKEASDGKL